MKLFTNITTALSWMQWLKANNFSATMKSTNDNAEIIISCSTDEVQQISMKLLTLTNS